MTLVVAGPDADGFHRSLVEHAVHRRRPGSLVSEEEMHTLSRRVTPATSLLFLLGAMVIAAPSPSAAQGVCRGFDEKHTIRKLGGPNAFAPGGTHKRTRAELRKFFAENSETIRA